MNSEDLTKSIENQLFSWEEWDQVDTVMFSFMNCKLLVPMLGFPPGEMFSHIFMDYENSQIRLFKNSDDESPVKTGTLRLSVIE